MDVNVLTEVLAEFFLDTLRMDAGDVAHWCEQNDISADEVVDSIKHHTGIDF